MSCDNRTNSVPDGDPRYFVQNQAKCLVDSGTKWYCFAFVSSLLAIIAILWGCSAVALVIGFLCAVIGLWQGKSMTTAGNRLSVPPSSS